MTVVSHASKEAARNVRPPTPAGSLDGVLNTRAMETVFSRIQPPGELHLGKDLGPLRSWVSLQGTYECSFCIVDYHAVTQAYQPVRETVGINRTARA